MPEKKAKTVTLKKLKKDGSIDERSFRRISVSIAAGEIVVLPVDSVYGFVCLDKGDIARLLPNAMHSPESLIRLVSSFKMLDEIVSIGKLEYDFLHRVWPGELDVILKMKSLKNSNIPVRFPRNKFIQDLISFLGSHLVFFPVMDEAKKNVYIEDQLIRYCENRADLLVIIKEICKEHSLPTAIDISRGDLMILHEGRMSSDEIKSLYFLGIGDSAD